MHQAQGRGQDQEHKQKPHQKQQQHRQQQQQQQQRQQQLLGLGPWRTAKLSWHANDRSTQLRRGTPAVSSPPPLPPLRPPPQSPPLPPPLPPPLLPPPVPQLATELLTLSRVGKQQARQSTIAQPSGDAAQFALRCDTAPATAAELARSPPTPTESEPAAASRRERKSAAALAGQAKWSPVNPLLSCEAASRPQLLSDSRLTCSSSRLRANRPPPRHRPVPLARQPTFVSLSNLLALPLLLLPLALLVHILAVHPAPAAAATVEADAEGGHGNTDPGIALIMQPAFHGMPEPPDAREVEKLLQQQVLDYERKSAAAQKQRPKQQQKQKEQGGGAAAVAAATASSTRAAEEEQWRRDVLPAYLDAKASRLAAAPAGGSPTATPPQQQRHQQQKQQKLPSQQEMLVPPMVDVDGGAASRSTSGSSGSSSIGETGGDSDKEDKGDNNDDNNDSNNHDGDEDDDDDDDENDGVGVYEAEDRALRKRAATFRPLAAARADIRRMRRWQTSLAGLGGSENADDGDVSDDTDDDEDKGGEDWSSITESSVFGEGEDDEREQENMRREMTSSSGSGSSSSSRIKGRALLATKTETNTSPDKDTAKPKLKPKPMPKLKVVVPYKSRDVDGRIRMKLRYHICYLGGNASVTIKPNFLGTRFKGWGTSLFWSGQVAGGWSKSNMTFLARMLFNRSTGVGLNMVRFNIAGGYHPDHSPQLAKPLWRTGRGYRPWPWVPKYTWEGEQDKQVRFLQAAMRAGATHLSATSYSAPWWMTESLDVAGAWRYGHSNLRGWMYDDYATYIADVMRYYAGYKGIRFHRVAPFNEPLEGWWVAGGSHEGCNWKMREVSRFLPILARKLREKRQKAKIGAVDSWAGWSTGLLSSENGLSKDALATVHQVDMHGYRQMARMSPSDDAAELLTLRKAAAARGKRIWQTEWGPLRIRGSDVDMALLMARTITQHVGILGAEAWFHWLAFQPSNPTWGLLRMPWTADAGSRFQLTVSKQFFVMKHFTKWVRPGSYPIEVRSECNHAVLAVYHPGRALVSVTITNQRPKGRWVYVRVEGFRYAGEGTDHCLVHQYRTSMRRNHALVRSRKVRLPAWLAVYANSESVTTLVIYNVALPKRR